MQQYDVASLQNVLRGDGPPVMNVYVYTRIYATYNLSKRIDVQIILS